MMRMARPPEAQRRLRDIATMIDTDPARYNQLFIASVPTGIDLEVPAMGKRDEPWCKSAFCIAGWNQVLAHFGENDTLWIEPDVYNHFDGWLGASFDTPTIDVLADARREMGLTSSEASLLFGEDWTPRSGLTVGEALRLIAEGSSVADVTNEEWL